eukprot:2214997-Lingulodinium_polyedra.AAC.1
MQEHGRNRPPPADLGFGHPPEVEALAKLTIVSARRAPDDQERLFCVHSLAHALAVGGPGEVVRLAVLILGQVESGARLQ